MKLSFSTKGWCDRSWDELVDLAEEMGFNGIEVFDVAKNEELVGKGAPFHKYNSHATVRALREKGLQVAVLNTSIDIADGADHTAELQELIALACDLGANGVCVTAVAGNQEAAQVSLSAIMPFAEENKMSILIETAGIYADTACLRELMDAYASDYLGALWSVRHPYWEFEEKPAITIRNLGAYVKHVHMVDSDHDHSPALVGEGMFPLSEVMAALSSIDYDGFISLEWMPEWMEDLTEPEIIMPHFVNYMQRFASTKGAKRSLQWNHDNTGQFIWPKFDLIDLTFGQVLDRVVEEFPNQYAFKYTTLDYTRTYEEFREDVDNFARALVSMGVKAGSKVAIWATNVPAWYITFWAATKIGAVLVTVNTAYKIHEAEYLFRQSDTHTIVMIESALDSNYAKIMNELCPEIKDTKPGEQLHCKKLPFLRNVITVGFKMDGCLTLEQAMERAPLVPKEEILRMAANVHPDDVCNMQYTSGTTGFPKGVMLTHRNVVNDGKTIGDRMGLSTADRMMIQVPMFHCFGMVLSMTSSMTHGATMCPMPYFSAKASLSCITQERITCFNGVPTMFIAMFNHPDYRKTDFSHMRTGIMAGAGCPPDLMKRAAQPDEINMTGIISVYGQTETSPGSTMSEWTDSLELRTETVGHAFPYIDCKIVDPDTGEEVPDGTNGEFCSRGYNTMKGYYKMPNETRDTIDAEGWLHSGDMCCRTTDPRYTDKDGNMLPIYVVTGRLKDMIIRGGENLYPKEIEDFLYTHPKVQDVQVVGVPDEKYGEEAAACVILKEGETMTEPELREFMKDRIARHKVPRYIKFVDEFPMNAAGKILKYKMREELAEEYGLA
ncbi:MAG: AMP-binding protein [Eggerthellales bacterium]|nr:AMP-binding protein [Eggerthellales bacterium]